MRNTKNHPHRGIGAFEDQSDESAEVEGTDAPEETSEFNIEIPEADALRDVSSEDLAELRGRGVELFELLRPEAEQTGDDSIVEALSHLVEGLARIDGEVERRAEARKAQSAKIAELAARLSNNGDDDAEEDGDGGEEEDGDGGEEEDGELAGNSGAPRSINITLSGVRNRQPETRGDADGSEEESDRPRSWTTMVAADGTPGLTAGSQLDISKLTEVLATRLEGVSATQYVDAAKSGKRIQTQVPAALIKRTVPKEFRIERPGDGQNVLDAAVNEWRSNMVAGDMAGQHRSLTAAAWCAPSTTLYDVCEIETTEGLLSLPGVSVSRGGIQNTTGPDFAQIFADGGFCFTSAEMDEQSPPGSGPKPCFTLDCPDFVDNRCGVCGTCIRAGLLQNRAFPELLERTVRGAITAHAHRLSGSQISAMVAGSDAVTMPATVGGTASLLGSVELQIEHFRYVNRASRVAMVEIVMPFYARGIIREDLSRRLGVNLLGVSDEMISDWFALRGARVQFVYNFDDLTGDAASQTTWPDNVRFLLYSPGTWVAGTDEVIRIDTLFDSALLAQNDFTALFLEECSLVVKTCPDSRIVTVPVCVDGHTGGGIAVDCDGVAAEAVAE